LLWDACFSQLDIPDIPDIPDITLTFRNLWLLGQPLRQLLWHSPTTSTTTSTGHSFWIHCSFAVSTVECSSAKEIICHCSVCIPVRLLRGWLGLFRKSVVFLPSGFFMWSTTTLWLCPCILELLQLLMYVHSSGSKHRTHLLSIGRLFHLQRLLHRLHIVVPLESDVHATVWCNPHPKVPGSNVWNMQAYLARCRMSAIVYITYRWKTRMLGRL
jgi:hypothetical protein